MRRSASVAGLYWLNDYVSLIDRELSLLRPDGEAPIQRAASDALSGGGKRVRAVLGLLWCEAFSGDCRKAVPIAAAYELAHATALIQDDIIDHSEMRRGEKSTVGKYGLVEAILASDLLLFHVPKEVAKYRDMDGARLASLFDLVGEACRATTLGEYVDLELSRREQVTEDEYEEMIRLKTASLIGAPAASGAIVGGASDEEARLAYRFGERLGMAYQIRDDMLDMMGEEEELGKPIFTDIRGSKKNLLTVRAMEGCSRADRSFMAGLFGRDSFGRDEVERARRILLSSGAVSYAQARISHYVVEAKDVLEGIGRCRARDRLAELSDYLAERYA